MSVSSLYRVSRTILPLVAAAFALRTAWRRIAEVRALAYEVPGSRSTIPDEDGHYDMDGVSFDDDCGVVVGSDGRTHAKSVDKRCRKSGRSRAAG